jgi:hypothetical protein
MSFTLVINSKNSFGANNNTYKYDFIQGNFNIPPDSEVMIANVQIPYSFYNISQAYNNNSFQFSFPTGSATFETSTITIPDGFYTTTSLNYYLQQYMIANGYYLVNSAGQNVYYYTIQYNSYQYGNQLLGYLVPTSLPAGYSYPAGYTISTIFGGNGFPTISRTPYITILNNNFGTFLGYTAGNYPNIGSGCTFSVVLAGASIASFTINTAGSGYKGKLPVVLTGGAGTNSGFTATVTNGVITAINAGTSSGYTTAPTVSVTGGGGTAINITCVLSGASIGAFTITSGGTGYTSTTPVTITGNGTASGYNATVSATGTITGISGGTSSGFTKFPTAPVITITTPLTGTGFVATANLTATSIASISVVTSGINFFASPVITFTGGGGSGASATGTINSSGNVVGYTGLIGGSGYTSLPTAVITFVGSNYSGNSLITPVGSTVNSIIVRCSLVDNKVGIPMDILDSFTIGGVGFGNNINYSPNTAKWVKLSSGSFSNFYITFCDQNLSLLPALDNNVMVTLLFRLGKPKSSLTNE